ADITVTSAADQSVRSLACAGSLSVSGSSTLTIASASTIDKNLTLFGDIDGSGDLTVGGTLDWQSGNMRGTGATTIAVGGLLTIPAGVTLERTLHNAGRATWSSVRELDGSGLFDNQGSFTASADAVWFPNFANAGAFLKTGPGSSFFHS